MAQEVFGGTMRQNKKMIKNLFLFIFIGVVCIAPCAFAGSIYQDFEPNNGSDNYGWTWDSTTARLSLANEPAHSGGRSWKVESSAYW